MSKMKSALCALLLVVAVVGSLVSQEFDLLTRPPAHSKPATGELDSNEFQVDPHGTNSHEFELPVGQPVNSNHEAALQEFDRNFDHAGRHNPSVDPVKLQKIRELESTIRQAEGVGDEEREASVVELKKLMQEVFDRDFARREAEVVKVEAKVAALRAALNKRKQARDRIIENRIDGLLLEADGLAFPLLASDLVSGSRASGVAMNAGVPRGNLISISKQEDGSQVAEVRIQVPQRNWRQVTYQTMVPAVVKQEVQDVEQSRRKMVPQTRTRLESYFTYGPGSGDVHRVIIPKGSNADKVIGEYAAELAKWRSLSRDASDEQHAGDLLFDSRDEFDALEFGDESAAADGGLFIGEDEQPPSELENSIFD